MRILSASVLTIVCVSCSLPPPQGGKASKEELADAYLAALQAKDKAALWSLVHPWLVARLDDAGRRHLEGSWTKRMSIQIDTAADRRFKNVPPDADFTFGGAAHVYVPCTHTIQFDGTGEGGRRTSALVYVNLHDGKWFITSPIPKQIPTANPRAAETPAPDVSCVVQYAFEPNPKGITPKMYNWEVMLSKADSGSGNYEILQVTRAETTGPSGEEAATETLIGSGTIVPDGEGLIHFDLHVGEKEPTKNMGGAGHIGQPIIFSGAGTGKGASSWIIMPGTAIQHVSPSGKGTIMRDGGLTLLQIVTVSGDGKKHRADIILRRAAEPPNPHRADGTD